MTEHIFTKYSNERDRRFSIRTDILEEEGRRFIRKSALYPEGNPHVVRLLETEKELNQLYGNAFVCNHCIKAEKESDRDSVCLEYLEGETLEETLDRLIADHREDEAKTLLDQFLQKIREIHAQKSFVLTEEFQEVFGSVSISSEEYASSVMNIDMVCENLIPGTKSYVLDYEWTFTFPIPYKYLIYRILFYYLNANKMRSVLKADSFYEEFGITSELQNCFDDMEKNFQRYITGKHVPVREMYPSITPGVAVVKTVASSQFQVYFSFGGEYREEDSCFYPIYGEELYAEIDLPAKVKHVRIDPGDHPCSVQILELSFDGKAADLSNAVIENGFQKKDWVHIAKNDPGIAQIPVPDGSRKMIVKLLIFPASLERMESIWKVETENRHLRAQNEAMRALIQEMKNTKVWKAYQTYRNMVEKKKK